MKVVNQYGKLMTVNRAGYLECPACRQNHRLLRIRLDTTADNLVVFCRKCKTDFILHIDRDESL